MARRPKNKSKKHRAPQPLEVRATRWPATHAWVNEDWRETPVATVVILRESPGGDLAAGGYLVDLGCRGVREAFVRDMDQDVHRRYDADPAMMAIEPAEAAAIVGKAEEWAARWELGGIKAWQTCRAFVETLPRDDRFEVPLGRDGKPYFLVTDTDRRPQLVARTLERTAGPGNYTITLGSDVDPTVGNELLKADAGYQADTQALLADLIAQTEATGEIDADRLGEALRALTQEHTQLGS